MVFDAVLGLRLCTGQTNLTFLFMAKFENIIN